MTGVMPALAQALAHWSAAAAAWQLAALAAKATLLLGLGAAIAPLVGRRSPAARHLVWAATLAGVLALPALLVVAPRWTPRTFAAWANRWDASAARAHASAFLPHALRGTPTDAASAGVSVDGSTAGRSGTPTSETVGRVAFLAWGLGAAGLLAALTRSAVARGQIGRRPLAHRRSEFDGVEERVAAAIDQLVGELGVRRPVRLLWGPTGTTPMTWGVRRPSVLLPVDAAAWPAAERDAVLRHELAHVRRGDAGWALVAELACALFWCHPGVWLARATRLRWQERAADAIAVTLGAERHAYAAALVRAAQALVRGRGAVRPGFGATPTLAPRAGLAERLRALTAADFVAAPCTGRRRAGIVAGVAAGAVALAALGRAAAATPQASTSSGGLRVALPPEPDPGAFVAADSTRVVLVPATADVRGVLGAVRALRREEVTAVYTTDDPAAERLAEMLAGTVGGSLIPYDRVGMTDARFAAVLVANAVGANPRRTVAVVVEPGIVAPFFRRAAAAAGVDLAPNAGPDGRPTGVAVLTVAPRTSALVRARY